MAKACANHDILERLKHSEASIRSGKMSKEPVHCDRCGYNLRGKDIGMVDPVYTKNEVMHHCRCYQCGYEWIE
jgi:predicted Zn-ribbon and HTH transcriptional regulator